MPVVRGGEGEENFGFWILDFGFWILNEDEEGEEKDKESAGSLS